MLCGPLRASHEAHDLLAGFTLSVFLEVQSRSRIGRVLWTPLFGHLKPSHEAHGLIAGFISSRAQSSRPLAALEGALELALLDSSTPVTKFMISSPASSLRVFRGSKPFRVLEGALELALWTSQPQARSSWYHRWLHPFVFPQIKAVHGFGRVIWSSLAGQLNPSHEAHDLIAGFISPCFSVFKAVRAFGVCSGAPFLRISTAVTKLMVFSLAPPLRVSRSSKPFAALGPARELAP